LSGKFPHDPQQKARTANQTSISGKASSARNAASKPPARLNSLLTVSRRSIPFAQRVVLANELALLSAAEISLALVMINSRLGVYPNQPILGTRHARRWLMHGGLCMNRWARRNSQGQ